MLSVDNDVDFSDETNWLNAKHALNVINDIDSEEVDQEIELEKPIVTEGESTPVDEDSNMADVSVISQTDQAMHVCVWIKLDKKELFCSFVYAHNSSFLIDIAMREFNECVEEIEMMDVSGLRFTWNQKPRGDAGILKKIDRVMSNLTFNDVFRPFKFTNILVHNVRFKEVVQEGWLTHVSGLYLFRVVRKLKYLKKPLRKLLYEQGNIHNNVKQLRIKLDQVQKDLDLDPFNITLHDEEVMYVNAFNDAVLVFEGDAYYFRVGFQYGGCTRNGARFGVILVCIDNFFRDRPWCILGDFNAALNLDDSTASSFRIDIAMREFNECVEEIEMMDVSGIRFTWNQKPRGDGGILKKIDRVMSNLTFNDVFVGAHAIFQPY
nr:hypothetical protein [Tanacetum cinerariifolium]